MSPPKRQSVSRRGFLAAMAATSAAVGAFALSARAVNAAPWSAAATNGPTGSTARAARRPAGQAVHAAHTIGENAMLDQMNAAVAQNIDIRPFVVDVPQEKLDGLRQRIAATQWPERETVTDSSQGVPLATMQALAHYWGTDYD